MQRHDAANEDHMSESPVAAIAYSPAAAAKASGRSKSRIYRAIRAKELTARKDGKATLIEHSEIQRWVQSMPTIGRDGLAA
jgi:excisionase family DNA binding protein